MTRPQIRRLAAAAFAILPQLVTSHSWVEQTMRIASNGTMIGTPGFERSHFVRGSNGGGDVVWLIPPDGRPDGKVIHTDDKIARPEQRALSSSSYTGNFNMLNAAPGDFVALQYQENGHVTLTQINPNKTLNGGTVYVYGTTNNDLTNVNLVDVHFSWTADGTGGDGKGKLIATRNYDDGQCYQINGQQTSVMRQQAFPKKAQNPMGADLWCQTDIQIPSDVPVGQVYTVIWVWDWPTMSETGVPVPPASLYANDTKSNAPHVTQPQLYTSVIDIKVVDPCDDSLGDVKGPGCHGSGNSTTKNAIKFAKQANLNVGGSQSQLQNLFQVAVPQADSSVKFASEAFSDIPMFTMSPSLFNMGYYTQPPVIATLSANHPAASPSSAAGNSGVVMVTVTQTVAATTVFVTETVTAGATSKAHHNKATKTSAGTGAITPSPFMKPRRVRRAAGEWHFGEN